MFLYNKREYGKIIRFIKHNIKHCNVKSTVDNNDIIHIIGLGLCFW